MVAKLSTLSGDIVSDLYGKGAARICLDTRADEILNELESFWKNLPFHLKPEANVASSYQRAVLYLGLRYDYAILLATRPSIVSCWNNPDGCSPQLMRRVHLCEEANKRSLRTLKRMEHAELLSRLNFLDASYILANILVFTLRLVKDPSFDLLQDAEDYQTLFNLTEHLNIGRAQLRHFVATVDEIRMMLR